MKGKRAPLFVMVCSVIGTFLLGGPTPQNPATQEELIRQWKNSLKEFPPLKTSTELEFRFSFPAEELADKDIYLWRPIDMACDSGGNVYVLDLKLKSILKFDPQGRFLLKRGREGQGPGDFLNPRGIYLKKTSIFVSDTSKRDIQIFDLDLNLMKSLKVPREYMDLAISDEGLIIATPFRMNVDMPLVDVLNQEGELLYSFGKRMFGDQGNWQIPNFVNIDINRKGEVFLAFQHFPTVCKYSIKGELRAVIRIDHKGMRRAEKLNLEGMKDPDNRISWQTIYAIRAKENGFFILHNYPIAEVLEFDGTGRLMNDYWIARSHDYMAADFLVRETGNKDGIAILLGETSPENRIEVFRPKR